MSSSDIFVGIDGTTPDWFNAVHFEETFDLPMSFVNCLHQGSVADRNRKHYFAGPDIGGFKTPACVSMPLMFIMDSIAAMPKPLVRIAGRTLLDRGLDMLGAAGVETAVVNVHYLPDQIITHVKSRTNPECLISDERDGLLDSAGGILTALLRCTRRSCPSSNS